MDLGLTDRVALITGGTRGIGEATVRAFAAEGARVALTYAGSKDRAADLAVELGGPERALAVRYDLADPSSVEDLPKLSSSNVIPPCLVLKFFDEPIQQAPGICPCCNWRHYIWLRASIFYLATDYVRVSLL